MKKRLDKFWIIILIIFALIMPIKNGIDNMIANDSFKRIINNFGNINSIYIKSCKKLNQRRGDIIYQIKNKKYLQKLCELIKDNNQASNKEKRSYDFELKLDFYIKDNSIYKIEFYKDKDSISAIMYFRINNHTIQYSVQDEKDIIEDLISLAI